MFVKKAKAVFTGYRFINGKHEAIWRCTKCFPSDEILTEERYCYNCGAKLIRHKVYIKQA